MPDRLYTNNRRIAIPDPPDVFYVHGCWMLDQIKKQERRARRLVREEERQFLRQQQLEWEADERRRRHQPEPPAPSFHVCTWNDWSPLPIWRLPPSHRAASSSNGEDAPCR
jgi:hypothetical protein